MSNSKSNYPYKPKVVLTEKQASKEPVGSYYHPTEKTYRSGACPVGMSLKKGYHRKGYIKKNGTVINNNNVDPVCVKNKGLPGKVLKEYKVIKITSKEDFKPYGYSTSNNSNSRFKSLLEACKVLTYRTVVRKLNALKVLRSKQTDEKAVRLYNIFSEDIKMLQAWRKKNPDLYKKKMNLRGGGISNYLFKTTIDDEDLKKLVRALYKKILEYKGNLEREYQKIKKEDNLILEKYNNGDLSKLNVYYIKNMRGLFYQFDFLTAEKLGFNVDITHWNVINVENMQEMFRESIGLKYDLSKWNITNVKNMNSMFRDSKDFNQDLTIWNDKLLNLEDSRSSFWGCSIDEKYIPLKMTDKSQGNRNEKAQKLHNYARAKRIRDQKEKNKKIDRYYRNMKIYGYQTFL